MSRVFEPGGASPGGSGPDQVGRVQRQALPGGQSERSGERDSTSKRMRRREGQPGFLCHEELNAATPTEGDSDFPDDDVFNEMYNEEERQIEEKIRRMLDWYKKEK